MTWLERLSIKHKLIAISMVVTAISLGFAMVILASGGLLEARRSTLQKATTLARVIGKDCSAALTFNDRAAAQESLAALNAEPDITMACIRDRDGALFARFGEPGASLMSQMDAADKVLRFRDGYTRVQGLQLTVWQPIVFEKEAIGAVILRYSLNHLYRQLGIYLLAVLGVVLLSMGMALWLAARLQDRISQPILELAETMNAVSDTRDYGIRVAGTRADEIGTLFDGFNEMLSQIQSRDEALHLTQFSIDHAADAAYWIEAEGRLYYANHAACRNLGYPREALAAMTVFDIHTDIGPEDWPGLWQKCRQEGSLTFESSQRCQTGDSLPVELVMNYIDFKGRAYVCVYARDISQRRKLETQLERAQKLEAIGGLAAGVAHDLNNLLGGIVSYPQMMMLLLPEDSPLQEDLQVIEQSGQRAASIVQDMLTLARRGAAVKEVLSIRTLVDTFAQSPELAKIKEYHPQVQFDFRVAPDLLNLAGSKAHITHTVMNLISNAAEAMPQGGNCTLVAENYYLEMDQARRWNLTEGEYIRLSVADTGVGITAEDRRKVFEPFYTKKVMGRSGTGLGMTVVLATVTDHQGHIDLESREGEGSCFRIYLPATREKGENGRARFELENYLGTETILVVDDMAEQRTIAARMLEKVGYTVAAVSSGEAAIDALKAQGVDLLLLDMIMGDGMDGLDTYREVLKHYPRQRAVIVSGYAENDRVREALHLGCGQYIRKPFTMEKLLMAVREELDRS